jgi:hypothetical protein
VTDPNFPPKIPRSAEEVRATISTDWFGVKERVGLGRLKDALGAIDPGTLGSAIAGESTPRAHTVLNSLLADPAALLNTLLLFGVVAVPAEIGSVEDNDLIIQMLRAATEHCERMKDGQRCHNDTLALADMFAPLVPKMLAIIREAAKIRGGSE